jgi:hypothetical protein
MFRWLAGVIAIVCSMATFAQDAGPHPVLPQDLVWFT